MGLRGPRKKLPKLARLDGYPSKSSPPLPDFGVEAVGDVFVPDHLHEDAQSCIEVIKSSMPPGVYAKIDSYLLAAFAAAWALHKQAAHAISSPDFEHVVVNKRTGSEQPNAWIKILNTQAEKLASLGDRLGLDPRARAGLKLPAEKPVSKFSGLIGQPGSSASSRH